MAPSKNMCGLDRGARTVLGAGLIAAGFLVPAIADNAVLMTLVVGFGVVNVVSAGAAFCPLYWVAGISTQARPEPVEEI